MRTRPMSQKKEKSSSKGLKTNLVLLCKSPVVENFKKNLVQLYQSRVAKSLRQISFDFIKVERHMFEENKTHSTFEKSTGKGLKANLSRLYQSREA